MIKDALIERCLKDEREAHGLMYQTCAPYLYAVISNYISNKEQAKDCLQEVFIQIFLSLKNFDKSKASFKTWMTNICVYTCIKALKKKRKLEFSSDDLSTISNAEDHSFENLHHWTRTDVENYLVNMPEGYRAVFLLFYIDEYSHKEIAEMLNVSVSTSRSQLSRAVKWLKEKTITMENSIRNELV